MKNNKLRTTYLNNIRTDLKNELGLDNVMQIPDLEKIVVNAGVGKIRDNKDFLDSYYSEITSITGQKPVYKKSRVSIAGFKVRKNDTVGITVTLRGNRMWDFLEKFISVSLPRVRDFKGLNRKSFDKLGNYSVGIREHIIFPEVDANKTKGIRPLQINFVFKNSNPVQSYKLLEKLGVPFTKKSL